MTRPWSTGGHSGPNPFVGSCAIIDGRPYVVMSTDNRGEIQVRDLLDESSDPIWVDVFAHEIRYTNIDPAAVLEALADLDDGKRHHVRRPNR